MRAAVLLGKTAQLWQDRPYVLSWFGGREKEAMRAYREYVEQGIPLGRRSELVGGGLIRSLGGWSQVRSRRASEARVRADERILGSEEFVERVLAEAAEQVRAQVSLDRTRGQVQEFIQKRCAERGVNVVEVRGGSRRGAVAHLRAELARHLVIECGLPMAEAARQLGVTTSGIARALTRIGAT